MEVTADSIYQPETVVVDGVSIVMLSFTFLLAVLVESAICSRGDM